jgi:DNA-binding transcriptional LysR family regulator
MNLDLNAIRAFILVVEAGGITDGARRAGLPKSTVSRQMRDLEGRVGERLLERRGRGVAVTAAGRRLFESARGAIGALEVLRDDVLAPPVAGRVRVASPVMLARGPLKDVLTELLGHYPAVTVEVDLMDRFSAAEAPTTDVALCVGISPGGRAERQSLGFVEARLYAAPALLAAQGVPRTVSDLSRLPILTQGCAPGARAGWTLADPRGALSELAFTPRLVANDPDLLVAAALAGHGVCRMPTFLAAPHLRSGQLVPILDGHVAERHEVTLAVLRRNENAAVRWLAAEVSARLKDRLVPRSNGGS